MGEKEISRQPQGPPAHPLWQWSRRLHLEHRVRCQRTSKPRSARELSLCERLHPGWSGFDSPLVCAGTPRLFRLPAAHAGRHPQRHRGAAGKSVRAPDSLFGGGVPFTSGIFQLPRNHGLRLWRRLPQKNGDERLGGPQRLRSLAHPGIFVPEEEKSFHT